MAFNIWYVSVFLQVRFSSTWITGQPGKQKHHCERNSRRTVEPTEIFWWKACGLFSSCFSFYCSIIPEREEICLNEEFRLVNLVIPLTIIQRRGRNKGGEVNWLFLIKTVAEAVDFKEWCESECVRLLGSKGNLKLFVCLRRKIPSSALYFQTIAVTDVDYSFFVLFWVSRYKHLGILFKDITIRGWNTPSRESWFLGP